MALTELTHGVQADERIVEQVGNFNLTSKVFGRLVAADVLDPAVRVRYPGVRQ